MTPEERARHFVVGTRPLTLSTVEQMRALAHEFRLIENAALERAASQFDGWGNRPEAAAIRALKHPV